MVAARNLRNSGWARDDLIPCLGATGSMLVAHEVGQETEAHVEALP